MSQYNNLLILQEISNNEESVKVMKDELRYNFRFHNNTGVRKSFCDGNIGSFWLSLPCFLKKMTVE